MVDKNLAVTDQDFDSAVLKSEIPVLIDFWAPWCGPCLAIAPVIGELADDYQGRVKVLKLNVDENPETAGKYGVRSIPTLALFEGGEIREVATGAQPKANLEELIRRHVRQ
ncbi:MAG: thioredoxin [Gammaproteobacteria bacterium]